MPGVKRPDLPVDDPFVTTLQQILAQLQVIVADAMTLQTTIRRLLDLITS